MSAPAAPTAVPTTAQDVKAMEDNFVHAVAEYDELYATHVSVTYAAYELLYDALGWDYATFKRKLEDAQQRPSVIKGVEKAKNLALQGREKYEKAMYKQESNEHALHDQGIPASSSTCGHAALAGDTKIPAANKSPPPAAILDGDHDQEEVGEELRQ